MSSNDWKKKNYAKQIKVSSAVIAELMKGNKASNIAKANAPGASAEFREAVRRFYGKDVTKVMPMAGGKTVASGPRRTSKSTTSTTSKKPNNDPLPPRKMTGLEKALSVAGAAASTGLAIASLKSKPVPKAAVKAAKAEMKSQVKPKPKPASKPATKPATKAKSAPKPAVRAAKAEAKVSMKTTPRPKPAAKPSASKSGAANKVKAQGSKFSSQGIRYTKTKYKG